MLAWESGTIMITHQNSVFRGEVIELDGAAFRQCMFEACTLRFAATGPTELNGCAFDRSQLEPAGAAQLTLDYLRGFYQGLGDWGRQTVDALFETIRGAEATADRPAEPAPDRAALDAFGATAEGQAIVRGFMHLSPEQRGQIAALIAGAARRP